MRKMRARTTEGVTPTTDQGVTVTPSVTPSLVTPLDIYSEQRWAYLQGRGYVWNQDAQRGVRADGVVGVAVPGDPAYGEVSEATCRTCGGPVQHPKVVKCIKCCTTGAPSPIDLTDPVEDVSLLEQAAKRGVALDGITYDEEPKLASGMSRGKCELAKSKAMNSPVTSVTEVLSEDATPLDVYSLARWILSRQRGVRADGVVGPAYGDSGKETGHELVVKCQVCCTEGKSNQPSPRPHTFSDLPADVQRQIEQYQAICGARGHVEQCTKDEGVVVVGSEADDNTMSERVPSPAEKLSGSEGPLRERGTVRDITPPNAQLSHPFYVSKDLALAAGMKYSSLPPGTKLPARYGDSDLPQIDSFPDHSGNPESVYIGFGPKIPQK